MTRTIDNERHKSATSTMNIQMNNGRYNSTIMHRCPKGLLAAPAILHFDDVMTVNCALCDLIAHLTFQMRKVSVQEIQVRPPDVLHWRVWMAGHETNVHPLSRSWTMPQAMRARQKCLSL